MSAESQLMVAQAKLQAADSKRLTELTGYVHGIDQSLNKLATAVESLDKTLGEVVRSLNEMKE